MANRRQLKKSINFVCSQLLSDCVALSLCQGADREKLDALMSETLELLQDFNSRISHCEKGKERLFFQKFRQEFTEKVNDLSKRIAKA